MDINSYHELSDLALESLLDQFETIVDDHARGDDFDVGYSVGQQGTPPLWFSWSFIALIPDLSLTRMVC